jgi:hypothetical protein
MGAAPFFGFPCATLIAKDQATDGSGSLFWFSLCNIDCERSSDGWERLPFLVFLLQHGLRNIKPLTEAAPFFGFPCATLIAKNQATDRSGSLFWFSLCNIDCQKSSD